jgi:pre-rRNA-processing protein TSR2
MYCSLTTSLLPFNHLTKTSESTTYYAHSVRSQKERKICSSHTSRIAQKQMASTSKATAEAAPAPAPNPDLILFARGVIARLELWPAFRIAIEQGWGTGGGGGGGPSSREKRLWLASEIVEVFEDSGNNNKSDPTPDAGYVALMLAQVLDDEFDATFEDGSVEAVAEDVVALWGAGEDVVEMWERKAEGVRGKRVDVRGEVESDDDGDGDEDEWEDESGEEGEEVAPQLVLAGGGGAEVQRPARPKPIVDEDGFTLVQKGR